MNRLIFAVLLTFTLMISLQSLARAEIRVGGGIHYWTALDDIEVEEVDEVEVVGHDLLGADPDQREAHGVPEHDHRPIQSGRSLCAEHAELVQPHAQEH